MWQNDMTAWYFKRFQWLTPAELLDLALDVLFSVKGMGSPNPYDIVFSHLTVPHRLSKSI